MISAAQALHFGLSSPSAPVFLLDPFWDLLVIYNNRTASLQTQTSRLHSGREPSAGAKSHIPPSPPIPPTPAFSKAPPPLHHNCLSFTQSLSFSTLKQKNFFFFEEEWEERRCLRDFGLEAVYFLPRTGHCVCGVTTSVLFDCIVS